MKKLRLGVCCAAWSASLLMASPASAQVDPAQAFYAIAFTHGSPHTGVITAQRTTAPFDVIATAARGTVNGSITLDPVRGVLYGASCCTPNLPVQAYDPRTLLRVPARDLTVVTSGSLAIEVDGPRRVLFLYDTVLRTLRAYSLLEGSAYGTVIATTTLTDLVAEPVPTSVGDQIAVNTNTQELIMTGGDGGPVIALDISPLSATGGTFGPVRYTGQRNRTTGNSGGGVAVDEEGRRIFFFQANGTIRVLRADAPYEMIGDVFIPSMAPNDCGLFFDPRTRNLYVGRGATANPAVVSFPSMSVTPFPTGPGEVPALSFAGATPACIDRDRDGVLPTICAPTGTASDCDDARAEVNPTAVEICNGRDDDCDGLIDEGYCRTGDLCFANGTPNPANACELCVVGPTETSTRWTPRPTDYVCRPAAGLCDTPETCSSAGLCPPDTLLPSTTVCRASAGPCDVAESCTGTSPTCPTNAYAPSSTVCRAAASTCDLAESCSGTSPQCPDDTMSRSPIEEQCDNGADDDCDGMTDERPCAMPDAGTPDVPDVTEVSDVTESPDVTTLTDVADVADGASDPPFDAGRDASPSEVGADVADAEEGGSQLVPDAPAADVSTSDVATTDVSAQTDTATTDASADVGPNGGTQGGCGCTVPASRDVRGFGASLVLGLLAIGRRRRRATKR